MTVFEDGLYASLKLVPQYGAAIQKRCAPICEHPLDEGLHCTITYSDRPFSGDIDHLPHLEADKFIPASVKDLEFWEGHDKKGYLVMHLDGEGLHNLQQLVSKHAPHSFDDYTPHTTLFKGDAARSMKNRLPELKKRLVGMPLRFHKLIYEPLS